MKDDDENDWLPTVQQLRDALHNLPKEDDNKKVSVEFGGYIKPGFKKIGYDIVFVKENCYLQFIKVR